MKAAEPTLAREQKLARLQFTDADRRALAFVPPGPFPIDHLAEQGIEWAQKLVSRRAQHASARHTIDPRGYCYLCDAFYTVARS